jgi:hypothetical protein
VVAVVGHVRGVVADETGGHHVGVFGPGEVGVAHGDTGVAVLELLDVVLDRLDRIAPTHEVELERVLRRDGAAEHRGAETEGGPAAEYIAAVDGGAATQANEPADVLGDHCLLLFAVERATGAALSRRRRCFTDQ